MRVIKAHRGRVSKRVLEEVRAVLEAGGVVAFPTESSYGLAADPRNSEAVGAVYAIKKRAVTKALPLVADNADTVRKCFSVTKSTVELMDEWPAPLTLVLKTKKSAKLQVEASDGTAAVRVSASAWARAVAAAGGGMVTSTSANISGNDPIFDPREIERSFARSKFKPDLLIDVGKLAPRKPSTIVRVVGRGMIEVLRQGAFKMRTN